MPIDTLSENAHAGQKASFYYGAKTAFYEEFATKVIPFKSNVAALNTLIGEVPGYIPVKVGNKFITIKHGTVGTNSFKHTEMNWSLVFEGIPEEDKIQAQILKDLTGASWANFQIYRKRNYKPRLHVANTHIQQALKDCEEDSTWDNHNKNAFEVIEGKTKYRKPNDSEASILVGASRWIKKNPGYADDSPEMKAIREALREAKEKAHERSYWEADITKIVADIAFPDLPDPFQDYVADYTKVQDGTSTITVSGPQQIDFFQMTRDEKSHVHRDFGVGVFSADLEHLFSAKITAQNGGFAYVWAISQTLGSFETALTLGIGFRFQSGGYFVLHEATGVDSSQTFSNNVQYYFNAERVGGIVTVDAWLDVNMTSHVMQVSRPFSLACQYHYALSSFDTGEAALHMTGVVYGTDLQEAALSQQLTGMFGVGRIGLR